MIGILILSLAIGEPPQAPPIGEPPQAPPINNYRACRRHVEAGGRAILAVGIDAPPGAYRVDSLEATAPGLWECYLKNGRLMMEPLKVPQKMPGPVKRLVKQCIDGVCRLVEVDDTDPRFR
jgi:hypothetical protein